MTDFLKKEVTWGKFELLIDAKIFPKDIVLKAAYNFLDKGYFFFRLDTDKNIILQFTPKDGVKEKPENIIWDFSDELLNVYLRNKIEIDNKEIRETIINTALGKALDSGNFVSIDTDNRAQSGEIDFDKDIDEILREIENDPDLKIDEAEIERILKEIEEESKADIKPIVLDPKKVKNAKKTIQNRK